MEVSLIFDVFLLISDCLRWLRVAILTRLSQGFPGKFNFECYGIWMVLYYILSSYFCLVEVEDPRISAEEMDERRKQNLAYEYLCHLEEAKM